MISRLKVLPLLGKSLYADFKKLPKWLRLTILIGGSLSVSLVVFIMWFVVGYYADSWHLMWRAIWHKFVVRQIFPEALHWTPFAFILTALSTTIALVFSVGRFVKETETNYGIRHTAWNWKRRDSAAARTAQKFFAAVIVLSLAAATLGLIVNDKDEARHYGSATEFVVEDIKKLPRSLEPLKAGGGELKQTADQDHCRYTSVHDVPSCITQGVLPSTWTSRQASATGAQVIMSRTSGSVSNTTVMSETLTYIYDGSGSGHWTAVRNGINKQPVFGIVSWSGSGNVENCQFAGNNALKYAFDGSWGQNLDDELADRFPSLLFEHDDVWGYCDGDGDVASRKPVIVVPVTTQDGYGFRTVLNAAGVLVITGSPSGEAVIEHKANVKAGEFPGPVYPLTLVAKQREMVQWAAGRAHKNRLNFGFEPTEVATQTDNSSEYLLRDNMTGRLFWVTPMKPRGTESQLLMSYSITPADEVTSDTLNRQKVYVLPDGDSRIVNLDTLESRVGQAVRKSDPGFFTGDKQGRLAEFLPVNKDTWQVFAERGGAVIYRIQVQTDDRLQPVVQTLTDVDETQTSSPNPTQPAPPNGSTLTCLENPTRLSNQDLVACITQVNGIETVLLKELEKRTPR